MGYSGFIRGSTGSRITENYSRRYMELRQVAHVTDVFPTALMAIVGVGIGALILSSIIKERRESNSRRPTKGNKMKMPGTLTKYFNAIPTIGRSLVALKEHSSTQIIR